VLQEREYEPLGGEGPVKADVRIIAATNKRLADQVARGQFREDLYFRLNVVRVDLPPLVERREDIPLLVDHFIREFNAKTGKSVEGVSDEVMDLFMHHDFPGNVRELSNLIEHAFILCRGPVIEVDHLPMDFVKRSRAPLPVEAKRGGRALERSEVATIRSALERNRGHRGRTAAELGIDPSTLWRKMKRYGIEYPVGM
jgi:transcriptional regulator with PAS, ATPase and Fis domain